MYISDRIQGDVGVVDPAKIFTSPHPLSNKIARVFWGICCSLLYRPSPRTAHRFRVLLLRLFGADVDWTARPYSKCKIWLPKNLKMAAYSCMADDVDCYNVAPISIGPFATVSQYAYLCSASHDTNTLEFTLFSKPIHIESHAWVAARSYIGPGVTVRAGAVVGANACAYKDVAAWTIVGGNPARVIGNREITQ
jgi:putative colanic acid biosynthesis acetyltransferase WcaF